MANGRNSSEQFRVFDLDTGTETEFVQGVSLRTGASGGSVPAGTIANPLVVTGGGGGLQVNEDDAHSSGILGTVALGIRRDADTTPVSADNDYHTLIFDDAGNLKVHVKAQTGGGLTDAELRAAAVPVSLATVPSHAVTNAGTFAVQESGGALTALQLIDDTVFAEDVAATAADKGIAVLAVRRDADTSLVGTDNDYANLQVNATGALKVEIFDGGESHTVDGTVELGAATLAALESITVTATDLDIRDLAFATDKVDVSASIVALDAATLTALETINAVCTNAGTFAVQESGAALTALQLIDDTVFAEDVAATAADKGIAVLAVRRDANTSLVGADNDYANLQVDALGALKVAASQTGTLANGTQTTVDATAGGVSILAANTARKAAIIQNVGIANIRVGVTGVSATTGMRLVPGAVLTLEMPYVPVAAIFAIREGAVSSIALTQEIA